MNNANELIIEANGYIDDVSEAISAVKTAVEDVDGMIVSNTDAISGALQQINDVDLDSLNNSIASLSDILQVLANVANIFK